VTYCVAKSGHIANDSCRTAVFLVAVAASMCEYLWCAMTHSVARSRHTMDELCCTAVFTVAAAVGIC